jgi:hypothetical protein
MKKISCAIMAIIFLTSCEYYQDYVVTGKYFSPEQYTKIRNPGFKGGYVDENTYIPDTYILIYHPVPPSKYNYNINDYEPFSKSFYDRINIGDTICFHLGRIHPCSSYQLKLNKR